MAQDMFIQIGTVKGESTDKVHKDKIDVLAWSWGMSNSANAAIGGGAGAGKVNMQELSFTKYVDKASSFLQLACASGAHYPDALLIVRKSGGDAPLEYIKIKLSKVFISAVSTGGSGGEDRLTENVTLNFAKVEFEYQPQNDKGAADGPALKYGWDVSKNAKV